MIPGRIFGSRRERGWEDQPGDPLVARLEALAALPIDAAERVDRQRPIIRAAFGEAAARPTIPVLSGHRPPRLAFAVAAALLLVVMTVGGIAASGAGRPLYGVRLAAEELLLPAAGVDRAMAQLDRLDRRLDEARLAIAARDEAATTAALKAYDEIAGELMSGSRPGVDDVGRIAARLRTQLMLLVQLRTADPGPGPDGAIGSANAMLAWLAVPGPDGGPSASPGASTWPGASPSREPPSTPRSSPGPQPTGAAGSSGPWGSGGPNGSPGPKGSSGLAGSPGAGDTSGPNGSSGPGEGGNG